MVYDVLRTLFSFLKSLLTPRLAQGVLAREDDMTGLLPV